MDKEPEDSKLFFSTTEAVPMDIVDMHQRTILVIEKETAKNPAVLQKKIDTDNMNYVVEALAAEIDAATFFWWWATLATTDLYDSIAMEMKKKRARKKSWADCQTRYQFLHGDHER